MNLVDPDLCKRQRLQLPWEDDSNPFLRDLFGPAAQSQSSAALNPEWSPKYLLEVSQAIARQKVVEQSEEQAAGFLKSFFRNTDLGKVSRRVTFTAPTEGERSVAIEKWKLIISINPAASIVGRQLILCSDAPDAFAKSDLILQDTFRSKAPSTLNSRSGSFLEFLRWATNAVPDTEGLGSSRLYPISEPVCYDYLCFLRQSKAAPTAASKFKESVAFCFGLIGLDGAETCLQSRRIQGVALESFAQKDMDRSMDDFLVEHVQLFEQSAANLSSGPDKIFMGFVCALIHFRARMSDTFNCLMEPVLDLNSQGEGFVQVDVRETKTGKTLSRMRKRLPLVGSATGISKVPWAAEWLKDRAAHSLNSTDLALMPGISRHGRFTDKRMCTGEFCLKVREMIIVLGGSIPRGLRLGSHSAKHTLLSWTAKAGVRISIRRILGGHIKASEGSAVIYSRDALAGPLRELFRVLDSVHSGRFRPDETRSGRWTEEERTPPGDIVDLEPLPAQGVQGHVDVDKSEDSDGFAVVLYSCASCSMKFKDPENLVSCSKCQALGCHHCLPSIENEGDVVCYSCFHQDADDRARQEISSSSDSDSYSDSEKQRVDSSDSEAAKAAEAVASALNKDEPAHTFALGRRASGSLDDCLVQHRKFKTIHLCGNFDSDLLSCGRSCCEATHVQLLSLPAFPFPKCKDCFGTLPEAPLSANAS